MRLNTPVSDIEHPFTDGRTIVSATDLAGRITYANPYFVEVSGYSKDELLGAPHNILRHPDMPESAFADMWTTIKAGMTWTGVVKNRRKDGCYYWVFANVTPVMENGKPVGYLSVRTKPSREQIAGADALYKQAKAGKVLSLRQGSVVRSPWLDAVARIVRLPLRGRVALTHIVMLSVMAAFGFASLTGGAFPIGTWLAGFGAVVTLVSWRHLSREVVSPMRQALDAALCMAGGDMTANIETSLTGDAGQLLRALRQMSINLQSIIGDVRDNCDLMRAATHDIVAGNSDLSGRSDSQAATLEQTAASMEQLASTVKENAGRTAQGNSVAASAIAIAEKGGEAMERVVATISDISASSGKIADIVGIINGIAAQTNLLALNAAVEAARAGEAGRGFAVVATEVRSLAQSSAAAASEIKQLIEVSAAKVNAGSALASDAGETMKGIIETVNRVATIISEVSAASSEQSTGIAEVNLAVAQMDEVTQQNAQLVDQAGRATAGLEESASSLMESLAIFKLGRKGARAA